MISPANSPVHADPVSRRASIATSTAAPVIAITEGTRMAAGLVPSFIQPCMNR
jgi:hypothetical protein